MYFTFYLLLKRRLEIIKSIKNTVYKKIFYFVYQIKFAIELFIYFGHSEVFLQVAILYVCHYLTINFLMLNFCPTFVLITYTPGINRYLAKLILEGFSFFFDATSVLFIL